MKPDDIIKNLLAERNMPVEGRTIATKMKSGKRVSVITRPDGTTFTVIADVPQPGRKVSVVIDYNE